MPPIFVSLRLAALGLLTFTIPATVGLSATAPAASPTPAPGAPTAPPAPATPPARDLSYNVSNETARTPEEQQKSFTLPEGFSIELVAAESEGFGKFIGVTWDAQMRLWSMTALEYPVDANENQAASDALFARGGRDRVIVFDQPYGEPGTARPRVFADGLVMPLGVQPYRDGAYVQYGADIRFYRDLDRDGRADRHDVILTGFGTQDSHLFPHQFLRQPGGWIFLAQGLFNYSSVRRPDGLAFADGTLEVPFNQCKLARFMPDGSQFEALTAGPNNIWGMVTNRDGETFLQEANDIGYPVIPYAPGIHVATGSRDKLRPYQPLMPPPLGRAQMGGTGLSGLTQAEDHDGLFQRAAGVEPGAPSSALAFYLANPITGTIQLVRATPDGGRYRYEKLPDFLTSTDRWFRPIALHFGPDGALYIVDWYNKIISHNEVPREHPDRDKVRGRIWRVRHRDQPRVTPPNLVQLDDRAVLAHVGGPNALVSRLAWLELIDRGATSLVPELRRLAVDRTIAVDRRLGALWALEGLQPIESPLLATLSGQASPVALRREAIRIAAAQPRPEPEFIKLATPLINDPHPSVRAAVGDALRRVPKASTAVMAVAAHHGKGPIADTAGNEWERYERNFERYLARWALELNPTATQRLLASPAGKALPPENQLLALLALGGREAAVGLAQRAPQLARALTEYEVPVLAAHVDEPVVRALLVSSLNQPATRGAVLRALLALRTSLDVTALADPLATAADALLTSTTPADLILGAEVAGAFRLMALDPALERTLRAGISGSNQLAVSPAALAALRALRETGGAPLDVIENIIRKGRAPAARDAALAALASARAPGAAERLVALLPELTVTQRGRAIERLTSNPVGARALLAGSRGRDLEKDLGLITAERLKTVLPDDPDVLALWQKLGGDAASSSEPAPLTPAEAALEAERFAQFRTLANRRGNPENGQALFASLCLNCHQQGGKGGQIGPALDGVGNTGIEAILRNVLTPSAAMESAYRTYRVVMRDGAVHEGFLAAEEPAAIVLRLPGAEDRRFARTDIRQSGYLRRSLMPEGLIDSLPPEHVSDLFFYLKMLK